MLRDRLEIGSFSIYEQPKWERIVASTQVGFRVSIWVRIRVRLGLYFGCSYIEKGPGNSSPLKTINCDQNQYPVKLKTFHGKKYIYF